MSLKPKTSLRAALLASLGTAALGACDGGSNNGTVFMPPAPPPPASPSGPAVFGSAFNATFRLQSTAPPANPTPGDIVAIDKTIDPVDASAT